MRLLFDHHLSPRLVARLGDLFPGSSHVWLHGLDRADDRDIWEFARENGYTLVTKRPRLWRPQPSARVPAESAVAPNRKLHHDRDRRTDTPALGSYPGIRG
jgi:hypothetical protein